MIDNKAGFLLAFIDKGAAVLPTLIENVLTIIENRSITSASTHNH